MRIIPNLEQFTCVQILINVPLSVWVPGIGIKEVTDVMTYFLAKVAVALSQEFVK